MQIIRQNSDNLVMYAGANLTTDEITNLGSGWCDERVTPSTATVISGLTLPTGFIPDCWTYSDSTGWAVVAGKQDQVDVRIGMPSITVPTLTTGNIVAGANLTTDGVVQSYVDITWPPVATATYYEIRYSLTTDANWSIWSVLDTNSASNTYRINGLVPGKTYQFGIRANCLWGLSDWSTTVTKDSVSPSTPPTDVTGFSGAFANNIVTLSWSLLDTKNLHSYEIRQGSTWSTATVLRTGEYAGKYVFRPTASGTITYLIKSRDAVGNYSTNATSVSVVIPAAAAPTAITCTPILCGVDLAVTYANTPDIDYCEIWAATTNNRANASCIGITRNGKFSHEGLTSAAVRYYWAKTVNVFAQSSAWYPVSTTAGVQGVTTTSPSELLSLLHSSVTTDALIADLQALFLTGNINGVPTLGLDGSMVIDGSLTADAIAANQLIVGENVAMGANATITWPQVTGTGKPENSATVGAPAGTYVGAALAETLVSDTATAKTNAASALTSIADIAADSKLTPVEKSRVRQEWDTIYSEKGPLDTQATALGITTEKTALGTAYTALGNYLNAGTAYTPSATPPSWVTDANLSATTTIVGATFRSTFKAYYDAKIALLNKMAAVAATKADWANIASKPTVYTQAQIEGFATTITNNTVTTAFVNALNVTANSVNSAWVYAGTLTAAQVNATGFTANNANIGAYIASTDYNGSTSDPYNSPGSVGWCISKSGGAAFNNVKVRGNIEATSIKTDVLNVVQTHHIADEAVTTVVTSQNTASISTSASGDGTVIATATVVVQSGYKVILLGQGNISSSDTDVGYSRLIRGSTVLTSQILPTAMVPLNVYPYGTAERVRGPFSIIWVDAPTAGTYTYNFCVDLASSANNRVLIAMVVKK